MTPPVLLKYREWVIARIDSSGGADSCWPWRGEKHGEGYGRLRLQGRRYMAHRAVYELLSGPIPTGLEIDHLCRNRRCVNPAHLEPVTRQQNALRGLHGRLVTTCPHGHPYDERNTYYRPNGNRVCRACHLAAYHRKRAAA